MQRIIEELVDQPAAVHVRVQEVGELRILEVVVDDDDVGMVVGKNGATAQALRTLLAAWAGRMKTGRWQLEIAGERRPAGAQR